MQKTKRKPQSSMRKKFFKVVLILIAIPILTKLFCYGFARFGGEFASANVLPVHPESIYIGAVYSDGYRYRVKESIYNSALLVDDLRTWFIDQGISLSPVPKNVERTEFYNYDGYYGTMWLFDRDNLLQGMHKLSAWMEGWFDEMVRSCQRIRVYYDVDIFKQDFPDIQSDNLITPYVVATCWPNVK